MKTFAYLAVLAAVATIPATADGLADCAAIAQRDSRLECYDALARRAAEMRATATSTAAPPPATPAPPGPADSRPIDDLNSFGLTPAQRALPHPDGPVKISANISRISSAPASGSYMILDNGQTWLVLDDDGRLSAGDAISIKRASFGSFLMMTPSNHTYRVRRLK